MESDIITKSLNNLQPTNNEDNYIKGRIVQKTKIKSFSNEKCSIFAIRIMDQTTEIKITAFNNLTTKFYDMIEVSNFINNKYHIIN